MRANASRGFRLVRVAGMKVHAQTQRAEYIWMDGYESSGQKVIGNSVPNLDKDLPRLLIVAAPMLTATCRAIVGIDV